jgi:wobble nucleotide-excising tRNase
MMLRRFEVIKDCGIFEDYRWNTGVPDFERINVIYGDNGSGKTSLSNALDKLSNDQDFCSRVSITVSTSDHGNERTSQLKFDEEFKRIFVFGGQYIERNLQFDGDVTARPILTLGEKTIGQKKRIDELESLIAETETKLNDAVKATGKARDSLNKKYTAIARNVVSLLSRAGDIYASNGTYSQRRVRTLFEGDHSKWNLIPDKERKAALATVNSDNKKTIPIKSYSFTPRAGLGQEVTDILAKTPVSSILDTLQTHPEASSWVEEGRSLHDKLGNCLFCGGILTNNRKKQIEQHFSNEVKDVQQQVDALINEIQNDIDGLASLLGSSALSGLLFDDLSDQFTDMYDAVSLQVKTLRKWLKDVLEALKSKRENVIASVDKTITTPPSVDGSGIEKLLKIHNNRVMQYANDVQKSARSVELHLLKEVENEVDDLIKNTKTAEEAESKLDMELNGDENSGVDGYYKELASLNNSEGNPLPSAENMTRELVRILGRRELSFKVTPDGKSYEVFRYGQVAQNLSTGERTSIALLHFLEAVKHANTNSGKPVVVIDDPVSSLDRNAATGISTRIWSDVVANEHIEQVFLLTHSFELFRQWDIQIGGLKGRRGAANPNGYTSNMYELASKHRKVGGIYKRIPELMSWPPDHNENLRKKIRSTYHHEFMAAAAAHRELQENSSMETKLDATLLYPNVLRRMLETFLAFKDPASVGNFTGSMRDMGARLESLGYKGDADALRQQLTRFVHTGSHSESPDTKTIANPDEINTIITSVFTFMNAVDTEHFEGICKVTGFSPEELLQNNDLVSTAMKGDE